MHLQCMFAHKKIVCAGDVDDPLPKITPMALFRVLHYKVLLRVFLHFIALLCIPSVLCGVSRTKFYLVYQLA